MRSVYSHPDPARVHLARHALAQRGIAAVVRGEHRAGLFGEGAGAEAWAELWVADEARFHEATRVVQEAAVGAEDAEPWTCPSCREGIEPPFGACWRCGRERPEG